MNIREIAHLEEAKPLPSSPYSPVFRGRGDWRAPFMSGLCYDFALALSSRIPKGDFVATDFMEHVAIRVGETYFDVRGCMTHAQFMEGLHPSEISVVAEADVAKQCGLSGSQKPYASPEMRKARAAVNKVFGSSRK